jgi:hypothetical protein
MSFCILEFTVIELVETFVVQLCGLGKEVLAGTLYTYEPWLMFVLSPKAPLRVLAKTVVSAPGSKSAMPERCRDGINANG